MNCNHYVKGVAMWLVLQPCATWADAIASPTHPVNWWKSNGVIYSLQNAVASANTRNCLESASSSLASAMLAATLTPARISPDHPAVMQVQKGKSLTLRKAEGNSLILYTVSLEKPAAQLVVHHPRSYEFAVADAPIDLAEADFSQCFQR